MSESLTCDGCGKSSHPTDVRQMCDPPWFEITDTGGGVRAQHACSPRCLETIGREMEQGR